MLFSFFLFPVHILFIPESIILFASLLKKDTVTFDFHYFSFMASQMFGDKRSTEMNL